MAKKTAAKAAAKTKKPASRRTGRPSSYTAARAVQICERLAEGQSLRQICAEKGMPHRTTVLRWLARHEEFRIQYAQARELGVEVRALELLEIADDEPVTYVDASGAVKIDPAWVQLQRLRIDTRKWELSKLLPKKYGDKLDLNHGGQADNPLNVLLTEISGTATSSPTARLAQERGDGSEE